MRVTTRPAVLSGGIAVLLVALAAVVPVLTGEDVRVHFPPLHAWWGPRFNPRIVGAVVVAVLGLLYLPPLCRRLPWRWTVVLATGAAWLWTVSLGLSDGKYGFARVYDRKAEYWYDAVRVQDVAATLAEYVDRIPYAHPENWHTHVAGHPPAALLSFVGLNRVGVEDTFWVGMIVASVGVTAVAAVLLTLDELGSRSLARRAAPWLALAPLVVWAGSSGDTYFAAVAAWGLYALARAGRRGSWAWAVVAGLLLGWCVFLSYGLVLLGVIALTVVFLTRAWWTVAVAGAAAVVVALGFWAFGFAWWEAYPVLRERYYDGIASERAYWYWVWANIAAWTFTVGVATWAAFPAMVQAIRQRVPLAILAASGLGAIVLATLSGMSKAEVERIWLPFTVWVVTLPALLPDRWQRPLLASQLAIAFFAQMALITRW